MEIENKSHSHDHDGCSDNERAHKLIEKGKKLQKEGLELQEKGQHIFEKGKKIEAKGHELEKDLYIFVNRIRFDECKGVKKEMDVNDIAGLVGLNNETAIIRRLLCDGDTSEPLSGAQKIKPGDQFVVTRKKVDGGKQDRIDLELSLLRESSQVVEFVNAPLRCVIYRNVSVKKPWRCVDVMVPVPKDYPVSMIDRAALPVDSGLISKVKGSPQEIVQVGGGKWRLISYHPHSGGGGLPWNPSAHGFHTYLSEILAWLEVTK